MIGNQAWEDLVKAVREKGSNCQDNPERWCPPEDEYGRTNLPTAKESRLMCHGCPLKGAECRAYAYSKTRHVGVLDGRVFDGWGDQPMWEEDDDDEF